MRNTLNYTSVKLWWRVLKSRCYRTPLFTLYSLLSLRERPILVTSTTVIGSAFEQNANSSHHIETHSTVSLLHSRPERPGLELFMRYPASKQGRTERHSVSVFQYGTPYGIRTHDLLREREMS